MKITHFKSTLLTISHKHTTDQLEDQIQLKNHKDITQLSITNCNAQRPPCLPDNIYILNMKKCGLIDEGIRIKGRSLKVIELTYCKIKGMPLIESDCLNKLNLSHNHIEIVQAISLTVKILDLRDNRIIRISSALLASNTIILHEFLPQTNLYLSSPQRKALTANANPTYPQSKANRSYVTVQQILKANRSYVTIQQIMKVQILEWGNEKIIETCQQILDNDNQAMFTQIYSYLCQDFIQGIFQFSKMQHKYHIIETILEKSNFQLSFQERIIFLMPRYLTKSFLSSLSMECLIKSIANIKESAHLRSILAKIQQISIDVPLIASQKDLINYIALNAKHRNSCQLQLLLTQKKFLKTYQFESQSIIKYIFSQDSYELIRPILAVPEHLANIFQSKTINNILTYKFKLFKVMKKLYKQYLKGWMQGNAHNLYLPEYVERKSFCLKSDLYDYSILVEYEEMQGSYLNKCQKGFILKFYNKENQMSIAKRIGNELKKKYWKNAHHFRNSTISCIGTQ